MKVLFVQPVKTGTVRHCADNVDLCVATAIYRAANVCMVCGAVWPSGSKSGSQVPDPGSHNGFCVAHADLEMYGVDITIVCAANEGSRF